MNLFAKKVLKLSSGQQSDFKIECDALTDEDWDCLAYLISKKLKFSLVIGIPSGGLRLANELDKYVTDDPGLPLLICDDVLTTGSSMENFKDIFSHRNVIGVVVFARGKCPDWITPLFQM